MASGTINNDFDPRFRIINNYDSGNCTVRFITQSDGRLQIQYMFGKDAYTLEFSEDGYIREVKNGSQLWKIQ